MNTLETGISQLKSLAQKDSLALARCLGTIAKEHGAIGRVETARMSADLQRANEAGTAISSLKAECAAMVAQIPATQLVALRALVGDDPILIAQRFCAIAGKPIPGVNLARGK
jgi:hypothetical protein